MRKENLDDDQVDGENTPAGWKDEIMHKSRGYKKNQKVVAPNDENILEDWKEIKTRSILFVEVTMRGKLAKALREVEERLRGITKYRTKIVEGVGRKLKDILPNTDPWSGQPCGRNECIPCQQEGDRKQNCKQRNIVYESKCEECNPKNKKEVSLKDGREFSSIYVGESARSLSERVAEHWSDFRGKKRTPTF